ncbi:Na/Pi cotransporter family protein, partial [Thermodesulfobacteriota bacterium]
QKGAEIALDELRSIKFLDSKFVDTPAVALTQARAEIVRMGEAVQVMYDDVINSVKDRKLKELSKWRKREDALDILQKEITQFLVKVMQKPIISEESGEISALLRMTNNLERAGDEIENIAELMEELIEQGLHFSEGGRNDYVTIETEVRKFLGLVVEAISRDDREIMQKAQEIEETINRMSDDMKGNHIMRLQSGACTVDPGLILVDMLKAFEKIGDFCYNIAQAVSGIR